MLEEQIAQEDPDIIGWQEVRYSWANYRRTEFDEEDPGFHAESISGK